MCSSPQFSTSCLALIVDEWMFVKWDLDHISWLVAFWGEAEDVHGNWQIIQCPLGQSGDDMGLFRVIWYQMGVIVAKGSLWVSGAQQGISADQKGSLWLIWVQWDSVGFNRDLWRPVEFSGGQWGSFGSLRVRGGEGTFCARGLQWISVGITGVQWGWSSLVSVANWERSKAQWQSVGLCAQCIYNW